MSTSWDITERGATSWAKTGKAIIGEDSFLLLEDGSYLLLENSDKLLLESSGDEWTIVPRAGETNLIYIVQESDESYIMTEDEEAYFATEDSVTGKAEWTIVPKT